jgi:hypothetical protein
MDISLKYIEDEQENHILHNNKTKSNLDFFLHRLNNSIIHDDFQQHM